MKIPLYKTEIDYLLPVFFGSLCSLVFCAYLELKKPGLWAPAPVIPDAPVNDENISFEIAEIAAPEEPEPFEDVDPRQFFTGTPEEKTDLIREMYQESEGREWVINFFARICDSRNIAEVILANAEEYGISPALAFALCWEESRFNPMAVNRKNKDGSIDRGLFQLNNRSFPRLDAQAVFDPQLNAHYGMSHLRHCLNTGGSEIAALAMYNAGPGKVRTTGTPKSTLDYIHRILENRRKIETCFQDRAQRARRRTPNFSAFNDPPRTETAPSVQRGFM